MNFCIINRVSNQPIFKFLIISFRKFPGIIINIMRFALRKQDKIKEVLGNEYLENNILQSLNKYFENSDNDRIYSDIEPDGYVTDYGNKYPLLRINDVANSDAMLEFAVMGQMYDVLNLSYVGRMKG